MIKKILLSIGLLVSGMQASTTFLHNKTPYPIKFEFHYIGSSAACGCCGATIEAGPNGEAESGCGILNLRDHYTVWANIGNGMQKVIDQGAL